MLFTTCMFVSFVRVVHVTIAIMFLSSYYETSFTTRMRTISIRIHYLPSWRESWKYPTYNIQPCIRLAASWTRPVSQKVANYDGPKPQPPTWSVFPTVGQPPHGQLEGTSFTDNWRVPPSWTVRGYPPHGQLEFPSRLPRGIHLRRPMRNTLLHTG